MEKAIELGIGFVTGRANVCKIINNYFKDMIRQIKDLATPVNITLFVLYDLTYRGVERLDFYKIIPEVYKDINITFITPENIEEEKKRIIAKTDITYEEIMNEIKYYIDNNCNIRDEYKDRIEKTFKYLDHENSKRVFEKIQEIDNGDINYRFNDVH